MDQVIKDQLAPTGVLRVGVNMANFLLVTGTADNGDPAGVSPDIGHEVARRLGVPARFQCYASPAEVADAVEAGAWDIGNIGAEPQRAEKIAFTAAYCEIESTYLVPSGSPIQAIADVDRPGNRIAVMGTSAYGLWLERNIRHAELVRTGTIDESLDIFIQDKLEALAGLRPRLLSDIKKLGEGSRILEGQFSAVQQAIGTPRQNSAAARWLAAFVEEAKATGLIARLIEKHGVQGLSVAPPAD